jgi:hypothetical protein
MGQLNNEQIAAFLVAMDEEGLDVTDDGDLYALHVQGFVIGRFSSPKQAIQYVVGILKTTSEEYQ